MRPSAGRVVLHLFRSSGTSRYSHASLAIDCSQPKSEFLARIVRWKAKLSTLLASVEMLPLVSATLDSAIFSSTKGRSLGMYVYLECELLNSVVGSV